MTATMTVLCLEVYDRDLSVFDIDGDLMLELPVTADVEAVIAGNYNPDKGPNNEYSIPQIIKHTITHECGHAVGCPHNDARGCVMYKFSVNWERDGCFSPDSMSVIQIHNN